MCSHLFPFLQEYLDVIGLSAVFPRVEVYMIHGSPIDMLEKSPSDGETTEVE